ncbi:hypothetical protein DFP97_10252 [Paenibacillus prosopidis]|uniref:Uncharacterized protein n=1 Tax=Paenibacillus prosopidis TaxID=630520 RepID=A0A368WAF2_9BACL|nr:hypothetical protein DFP97_10252 [Paenibacillus prosopidis]
MPTHFNYETFTKYGVQPSKVKILNHAIDCAQYDNIFPPYPFPSEVKSFRFLYTLAFDYRKGLDLLLPSYCEEFSNTEDVSLILKIYVPNWNSEDNVADVFSSYIPVKNNNPHIYFIIEKNTSRNSFIVIFELHLLCYYRKGVRRGIASDGNDVYGQTGYFHKLGWMYRIYE